MPYFVFHGLDRPELSASRARVREAHRAYLRAPSAACRVVAGGPLLDEAGERMVGTLLVLEATDRAAAELFLTHDPYAAERLFERTSLHTWQWGIGEPVATFVGSAPDPT